MHILFYDVASPGLYDFNTLQKKPLRGTEATIIRVAHALSKQHKVSIALHCRAKCNNITINSVNYIDMATAKNINPDIVILLRDKEYIESTASQFPNAKYFLWMHNLPPKDLNSYKSLLNDYRYQIIAVSDYHAATIKRRLSTPWYKKILAKTPEIPVHTIYNPVEDYSDIEAALNPNQMLFASSPYKGLEESIASFNKLKATYPEYKLKVILPEKLLSHYQATKDITFIPERSNRELAKLMKESFCVFYPQTKRVETFGLIYAEANAVGTPVLAHDFGSAREVLIDSSQLINGRNQREIMAKITEWREQRPTLGMRDEFKIESVIARWEQVLMN